MFGLACYFPLRSGGLREKELALCLLFFSLFAAALCIRGNFIIDTPVFPRLGSNVPYARHQVTPPMSPSFNPSLSPHSLFFPKEQGKHVSGDICSG